MHTAVIRSPQAMSNEQSYRPRSPDLTGVSEPQHTESQPQQHQQPPPPNQQPLRLNRLPSYQIQEPSLPKGYSFSPRGSYDASPFFTQPLSQGPNSSFSPQQGTLYLEQSPSHFPSASLPDQSHVFSPISYTDSPQRQQGTNSAFSAPLNFSQYQATQIQSFQSPVDEMARLRTRKTVNYNEDHNGAHYEEPISSYPPPQNIHQIPPQPQHMSHLQQPPQFIQQPMSLTQQPQMLVQQSSRSIAPPMPPIDVKTKFPVARIKRIMQADEDVGKVAQATPTAVSKALELFMIALVTKGATEARNNNSKRVTATHLKHALLIDSQFDFLNEICEAVPDEGAKGSKGRAKSEAKSEDSDEDMGAMPKKKAKTSKKKRGGDDDGSD